jgi:hypothetical protein
LNKAITGKLSAFQSKIPKLLEPQFASFADKMQEMLQGIQPQGGEPKGDPAKGADNDALAKLQKDLEIERTARQKMEQERQQERENTRREKRRGLLEAQLTAAQVHPKLLPAAIRVLEDNLAHDDEGRVVFKRTDEYGAPEMVSVEQAIGDWAKSDEGKPFVAAPATGGAGTTPARRPQNPPRPSSGKPADDKEAKKEEARAVLRDVLAGGWVS